MSGSTHTDRDGDPHQALAAAAGGRLTIDLEALADNWRALAQRARPARTAAVVKADAYGIGVDHAVPALYAAGCRDFFVALAGEGVAARAHAPDARIFVLNGFFAGSDMLYRAHDLVPVLGSRAQIGLWVQSLADYGPHPCALQVDTGMNRIGLSVADALEFAADALRPAGIDPVLVMSHLACADQPAHPLNSQQLHSFQTVAAVFEDIESSLCNSAGLFLDPAFRFDLVRPGIALYGGAAGNEAGPLRPVVTLMGRVTAIHEAARGETVSYGAAERLTRDSLIATISVGYADGYPRALSGAGVPLRVARPAGGFAFAAGTKLPLLGRVTMDMTMFDITDLPPRALKPGDFVELIGPNVPLDTVAEAAGTIGYEILTALGRRFERIIVGDVKAGI